MTPGYAFEWGNEGGVGSTPINRVALSAARRSAGRRGLV
jgi:hypothetical protein